MPKIIHRTVTRTRLITPEGVIEHEPVVTEDVTITDEVGMVGTDPVQLPTRVIEQVVPQPTYVEHVIHEPAVLHEHIVQQPAPVQYVQPPVAPAQPAAVHDGPTIPIRSIEP
jgi:hypothetical protein